MPIDADHATAAVADTIAVTAADAGSPAGLPAFDSASQAWVDRPPYQRQPIPRQRPEVISVAVQLKVIRPPDPAPQRRRRPAVDDGPRRPGTVGETTQGSEQQRAPLTAEATATAATPGPSPSGWGGTAILVVPTLGLLGIVAAVVVVNEVNHWWVLVPAMLLALVATVSVLATVMRMLDGND
jgi:hypothetical protein